MRFEIPAYERGKGKNQQVVWICINHQMGGDCDMKAVKEKAVEQAFLRVMNRLIGSKDASIQQDIYRGLEEEYTLE
ncbi:MAG: recombinase zinc beta ribbon domain-containing protein [Desulfosporosinus sp.]|nr:recombinase zinc beta ribbon domain-containing protein [Desulfosporosinus sp.]